MSGRAFVLGNGPSLRDAPLDRLMGETTFAMNRINLYWQITHPETPWRPTFYLACDATGMDPEVWTRDTLEGVNAARHSFIRADRAGRLELQRTFEWPNRVSYFWYCRDHIGINFPNPRAPTSWHLPKICGFGSTLHVAVQIAVLMGFNPIYLLGCDLGFREFVQGEPDPNHFDPSYVGWDDFPWSSRDATLRYTHEIMASEARTRGVELINCTDGGLLEAHPRLSLAEVL